MKFHSLIIGGGLIGLIVIGAVAWYLISPLFIDTTVDEAFPFEVPSQEALTQMTEEEMAKLEADFIAAIPGETEMTQMPEEKQQAVATKVMEVAQAMPTHQVDDPMLDASEALETEAAETEPAEAETAETQSVEEQATETETTETETTEAEPAQPIIVLQGQFQDADDFHQGSGAATIYQLPDGSHVLRLEDFTVTNGPDLHVLLAGNPAPTNNAELGNYVDLGSLKGNAGNQNYEIPAGTDLSQYKSIVIYCQPFHVVFSTAALG